MDVQDMMGQRIAFPKNSNLNFFQNLITTAPGDRPESIEAVFPTMDYEFWKAIAQSGSNDPDSAIYYFEYAGDGSTNLFKGPGGKIKTVETWMNAALDSSGKPFNGLTCHSCSKTVSDEVVDRVTRG